MTREVTEGQSREPRYRYYAGGEDTGFDWRRSRQDAQQLSRERWNPPLTEPNYLIYRERRRILSEWAGRLPNGALRVLDVGGRIQPYRLLVEGRLHSYVAVDPQLEGLLDILAVGEQLPFPADHFDLVICTQVLSYVKNPWGVAEEIRRVLKPGGSLFLTTPAFFPTHHDERWRFMPDGLRLLLSGFSSVEVVAEGHSIVGICRLTNLVLDRLFQKRWLCALVARLLIPLVNLFGLVFDRFDRGTWLTANYSTRAIK